MLVKDYALEMEIVGTTIDDAAGEAFDKCAKVMGLPLSGRPGDRPAGQGGRPATLQIRANRRVDGFDY